MSLASRTRLHQATSQWSVKGHRPRRSSQSQNSSISLKQLSTQPFLDNDCPGTPRNPKACTTFRSDLKVTCQKIAGGQNFKSALSTRYVLSYLCSAHASTGAGERTSGLFSSKTTTMPLSTSRGSLAHSPLGPSLLALQRQDSDVIGLKSITERSNLFPQIPLSHLDRHQQNQR